VYLAPDNSATSIMYAFAGTEESIIVAGTGSKAYLDWVWVVYLIPLLLLLARFVLSIRHIIRIKNAATVETFGTVKLINTSHTDAPFSFFNWLFWNANIDKDSVEGRHMLQHELHHIRSKHSLDLVFTEIVLAACWFNPFFYLYRKEIKTIQEFLADSHASARSNTIVYAELLLLKAIGVRNQRLVNPFFHNPIKRRILMLTSSKKPAYQWLRKFAPLPLIVVTATIVIISCNITDEKSDPAVSTNSATINGKNDPVTGATIDSSPGSKDISSPAPETTTATVYDEPQNKNSNIPEVFTKVEVDAKYPGNWRKFLEKNLNGQVAVDNGAGPGTYTTIIQFIVDTKGNVSDVKALTDVGYGLEQEAIRVIKRSGRWNPAITNGKLVKAYRKQPITFQVTEA